ncbi:MAG: hypothetical protein V8Q30_06860 [Acutalibacteraceae bacterium]
MKAKCPECGAEITQPKFWYGGNYLDDAFPNNGPAIRLLVKIPWLSCPDHPDANCRIIEEESINVKAAWRRYLAVPGRPKEFLEELKRRRVNSYNIGESFTSLNEQTDYHHCQIISPDIQGIRWIDHRRWRRWRSTWPPLGPMSISRTTPWRSTAVAIRTGFRRRRMVRFC